MKSTVLIISTLCIVLTGCCPYDESDVQFTIDELDLISKYNVGDTLTFLNQSDSVAKWTILDIDTTLETGCFMQGTFHDIKVKLSNNLDSAWRDNDFTISKLPNDFNGSTDLNVYFDGFSGSIKTDDNFKSTQFTIIELRGKKLSDLIEIEARYMERKTLPNEITHIYWSRQNGVAAFKTLNNDVWIEQSWL